MRAICFIQEVKGGDLTMRQQILICRKALRKLRWPCVQELYAQAGTGLHRAQKSGVLHKLFGGTRSAHAAQTPFLAH